jgi:hypothetical protein
MGILAKTLKLKSGGNGLDSNVEKCSVVETLRLKSGDIGLDSNVEKWC